MALKLRQIRRPTLGSCAQRKHVNMALGTVRIMFRRVEMAILGKVPYKCVRSLAFFATITPLSPFHHGPPEEAIQERSTTRRPARCRREEAKHPVHLDR